MRQKLALEHSSALSIPARLGIALLLVTATLGRMPIPAAHAATMITVAVPSFNSTNIQAFSLVSSAGLSGSRLRIAPADFNQYGAAWWESRVSLVDERSFSTYFTLQISNSGNGGADGIVFAVQAQSLTAGSSGSGIGYRGISPSIGIEFDTWQNTPDPNDNHIGVDRNGSTTSLQTANPPGGDDSLESGTWHVWVDYDGPTDSLEVRMNQNSSSRPASPTLSRTIDLTTVFGPDVYVGFTSATGSAYANHDILSFYFNNDYIPGGIDPGSETYTQAPAEVTVSAVPDTILADGMSTSIISAQALDVSGSPVPSRTITLTTNLGSVNPPSGVTNGSGIVTSTLLAGTSYGIATVRGTATGGVYGEDQVALSNIAPTDIGLSNSVITENLPALTTVGTLTSTDVNASDTFTYTLVAGTGSDDNAEFSISGDALQTAAALDYEDGITRTVRISTTDSGGLSYAEVFIINLVNANDAPAVSISGVLSVKEDVDLFIDGISIDDADVGSNNMRVTLQATSGTLTISDTIPGGVTVGQIVGNASGNVVLTATLNAITTTLSNAQGVAYNSVGFFGTDVLTVLANDRGYTGSGGPQITAVTRTITVTSVNDWPTLDLIAGLILSEDAGSQAVNLSGISSGALNEAQTLTVTATSTNTTLIPHPVVSYTSPDVTGTLYFTPTADQTGRATIVVTVTDGYSDTSRSFLVAVTALRVIKDVEGVLGRTTSLPLGTEVMYTIVLTNSGGDMVCDMVVSDTLPAGVIFGNWALTNTAPLSLVGNTILWGPQDVPADGEYTLRFTANITTSSSFLSTTIVNTATLTSITAGSVFDSAQFTTADKWYVYLPLVLRNS